MSFSLDLNANQINQALNAAYSGLVSAGTGIVRLTGDQRISGIKTFENTVYLSGLSNLPSVNQISPTGNAAVDLGSSSSRFRTGYFSGVTGFTGYFEYLKVANLDANVNPNLINRTGNNLTLSGQTNIENLAVSGNQAIAGGLTVSGALNVTGNTVLGGTITATGDKSFSGTLSQSGSLNVFGAQSISGNLRVTGDIYCTGNFSANGNISFTGGYSQTGGFFVNSNNGSIVFTGNGASHKFSVFGPMSLNGVIYHSGDFIHTGNFYNTGNFVNTGSFTNVGDSIVNGSQTVTGSISSNRLFTTGIITSGTSNTAALLIRNNLTSSPSGGAVEYSRGQFFATNELTGAPNRALVNQTFSYIAPDDFVLQFQTGGNGTRILGSTGIYLSTGIYDLKYQFSLKRGAGTPIFSLGLTGDGVQRFNYRHGFLTQRNASTSASSADTAKVNITGNSLNSSLSISGIGLSTSANTPTRYEFNAVINVTGSKMKISPFIHSLTASTSGAITGINFDMTVTVLSTGTGINQPSFNGPWSDA